jgi:F-type H+-transporting ATPase subunit delta
MRLSNKQYAQVLDEAVASLKNETSIEALVRDFVASLSRDGKLSKINDILREFTRLSNKRLGIVDIVLETADKDSVSLPKTIDDKKVNLIVHENKDLIGGSIIKVGDYIVDNSVRGKINALKNY